jgi:hypothetical protein
MTEESVSWKDGVARPRTVPGGGDVPAPTVIVGLSDAIALTLAIAALGIFVTITGVLVAPLERPWPVIWAVASAVVAVAILFLRPVRTRVIRLIQRITPQSVAP